MKTNKICMVILGPTQIFGDDENDNYEYTATTTSL